MDSFSLDENDNPLPDAVVTSTPKLPKQPRPDKTTRGDFICKVCGKKYVLKFYFDKHVSSHANPVSVTDLDISDAVNLDPNDLSLQQLRSNNTGQADESGNTSLFKVPSLPAPKKKPTNTAKPKKKPHLICTYCLKGYVCSRSFKDHQRTHIIQEAASRFPDVQEVIENATEIGNRSLTAVANSVSAGKQGKIFSQLVGHMTIVAVSEKWKLFNQSLCELLVQIIAKKKFLLPSALADSVIVQLENVLSDTELCESLLEILQLQDLFGADILSQFLLEFCLHYTTGILRFISEAFANNIPSRRQQSMSNIAEPDKEDRQVIYYIGGSIMRGYLKIARRSLKSATWQSVAAVLKTKILVNKVEGDLDPDSEWTAAVDRGGLLYINSECQTFFVKVVKLIFASEKHNGSIDYADVIGKVTNSELCLEWDNLIGDSLSESVSIGLLNDIVLCFCRTCGRGFAKRRLNFIRSRPVVSLPTRHLVAKRKKL